jgi:hypothetical protein
MRCYTRASRACATRSAGTGTSRYAHPLHRFRFTTLLPTTNKGNVNVHSLVIVDIFTSFVWLRALADKSALTIAGALWDVFALFGVPRVLQSDQAAEFLIMVPMVVVRSGNPMWRTVFFRREPWQASPLVSTYLSDRVFQTRSRHRGLLGSIFRR